MKDSGLVNDACKWCYKGVWGVLTEHFCLPDGPPKLPSLEGETIEYLRPSIGSLNYRKFFFWFGLLAVDIALVILWGAFSYWWPIAGLLTAPLWLVIIIVPDIIAYIAIHLRYDTTWYVLSDRSMRLRRGIWCIHETTITFENIQNIHVSQGPIQRWFGFSNLMVSTAGGGGGAGSEHLSGTHVGILEGIEQADLLRQRILARSYTSVGIGDDHPQAHFQKNKEETNSKYPQKLDSSHIAILREIFEHTQVLTKQV